ncbi:hypothetical protein WS63_05120 [Burkholderia stagnalis]|uniref:ATP-binding protein n=1 Tax=Burkholderia stagnalis TaxID=1503054 RepID=UPI000757B5CF|nr:ATP-binding protein [Burkholderia stagnalis]KVD94048.1 hypothetical protein WS63_05120 [Burkholderia stagnalis]
MKSLRFRKLWLVSETERSAYRVNFDSNKTLLVGKNHTGKSTLVKHIFRTLGCDTRGKSDRWDSLALSALQFSLDDQSYTAYRRMNVYALRDDASQSVRATTSYREWSAILADLFDFRLMLPTHQDSLAQATPPYLFLPFYMDQDSSWIQQWSSFDKLSQFSSWKKPLVAYITGQRPNGYYDAKFHESRAKDAAAKTRNELDVMHTALARVKKSLPRPVVRIDTNAFRKEIADLIHKSTLLKSEQESSRKRVFEFAAQKQALGSQITAARNALRDLEGDLKYLTESEARPTLTCPTCGSIHENGFPVRLELIEDASTLRTVIAELEMDLRGVERRLSENEGNLNRLRRTAQEIESTLKMKKGALRLQDIVNSQSVHVVQGAFQKDMDTLNRDLLKQESDATSFKEKVARFDVPDRTKAINEFYSERIQLFASELEVQDLREDVKKKPEASISATGSALPRSLLAYQFAVLHTAKESGNGHRFPVVVDSPNQQGQDNEHLMQMLRFIERRTPADQQLILAVEEMPLSFQFAGEIVRLEKPFALLDPDRYESVREELSVLVASVQKAIDKRVATTKDDSNTEDSA